VSVPSGSVAIPVIPTTVPEPASSAISFAAASSSVTGPTGASFTSVTSMTKVSELVDVSEDVAVISTVIVDSVS